MPPQPTALNLDFQLAISNELQSFANQVCTGTLRADTAFTRRDYIFFGLTDKNLATFHAIKILAENKLPDDAFALVRVLAECTINAAFVCHSEEAVANDYADYLDYREWKNYEALLRLGPEAVSQYPAERVREMQAAFEAVKQRYENRADWCSLNLNDRALQMDLKVDAEFYLLRMVYNVTWRKACDYVHGSAASITSRVREENGGIAIRRTMTSEDIAIALYSANHVMFAMLMFLDMRLDRKYATKYRQLHARWKANDK